jgi:hypothetical protein
METKLNQRRFVMPPSVSTEEGPTKAPRSGGTDDQVTYA